MEHLRAQYADAKSKFCDRAIGSLRWESVVKWLGLSGVMLGHVGRMSRLQGAFVVALFKRSNRSTREVGLASRDSAETK